MFALYNSPDQVCSTTDLCPNVDVSQSIFLEAAFTYDCSNVGGPTSDSCEIPPADESTFPPGSSPVAAPGDGPTSPTGASGVLGNSVGLLGVILPALAMVMFSP
jgi:hypothetical protein